MNGWLWVANLACIGMRVRENVESKMVILVGDLLHFLASLPRRYHFWCNYWAWTPNFETLSCISLPWTFCLGCLGSGGYCLLLIYFSHDNFISLLFRRYCVGGKRCVEKGGWKLVGENTLVKIGGRNQTGEFERVYTRVWKCVSVKVVVNVCAFEICTCLYFLFYPFLGWWPTSLNFLILPCIEESLGENFCGTTGERKQWVKMTCRRRQTTLIINQEKCKWMKSASKLNLQVHTSASGWNGKRKWVKMTNLKKGKGKMTNSPTSKTYSSTFNKNETNSPIVS